MKGNKINTKFKILILVFVCAFPIYVGGTILPGSARICYNPPYCSSLYSVTFTESGLPGSTSWSVVFDGTTYSSSSSSISTPVIYPTGTYSYSVNSISGFVASPSSGSVYVGGTTTVSITFNPIETVTVVESGLPSGAQWSIAYRIGSGGYYECCQVSTTSSMVFNVEKGQTFSYQAQYATGSGYDYWPNTLTGSVTVTGNMQIQIAYGNPSNEFSSNWAGYVATGTAAYSVEAAWTVPTVSCSSTNTYSSTWVGIDGWSDANVEQIGTGQDCVNGGGKYYAWYEMFPADPVTIPLTINHGDQVSAIVTYKGSGVFNLYIADSTSGKTYMTDQTNTSALRTSVEFIQEAPAQKTSTGYQILPLANFGTVSFSACSGVISGNNLHFDHDTNIYSVNSVDVLNYNILKSVSSYATSTGDFSVTWKNQGP